VIRKSDLAFSASIIVMISIQRSLRPMESLLNELCRVRLRTVDDSLARQIGAALLVMPDTFPAAQRRGVLVDVLGLVLAVKRVLVAVLAGRLWAIGEWLPAAGLLPLCPWAAWLRPALGRLLNGIPLRHELGNPDALMASAGDRFRR
jgi:hypothetical protein